MRFLCVYTAIYINLAARLIVVNDGRAGGNENLSTKLFIKHSAHMKANFFIANSKENLFIVEDHSNCFMFQNVKAKSMWKCITART